MLVEALKRACFQDGRNEHNGSPNASPRVNSEGAAVTIGIAEVGDGEWSFPGPRFHIRCPYHDDHYWQDLQNRSPDEFDEACQFDETIRHLPGVKASAFSTAAAFRCGTLTSPGRAANGAR